MLRLSDEELPGGPRPETAAARLHAIAADFQHYHQDLRRRAADGLAAYQPESFGVARQGVRRRLGRTHLRRDLEDQPAQVALAANLMHPDYVQVVCGTLDQLPRAFAERDRQAAIEPPLLERTKPECGIASPEPSMGQTRPAGNGAPEPGKTTLKSVPAYISQILTRWHTICRVRIQLEIEDSLI